jgi:2,4-dienoyl-CoA reductase (NADPH2)
VLRGAHVGSTVAVIGAGGIGFDVSEFLLHRDAEPLPQPREAWLDEWGVDLGVRSAGGLKAPRVTIPARRIWLLQRKAGKLGAGLGKTSGWVHRATIARHGVEMLDGVSYLEIGARGLKIARGGVEQWLDAETIVVCAGQEPLRDLLPAGPAGDGPRYHVIGGAALATELDAKRAIREGAELAARL